MRNFARNCNSHITNMITTDELHEIISAAIKSIKYPQQPNGLYEPIKYTLEGGGKRMRPMLTLAVCSACGKNAATAINQALGIEMYHNFTLLHDDVMDRAELRRGRMTVHCRWNDATAILSGDAMLTMAQQLVTKNAGSHLEDVLNLFNKTAMEVYEGQQYDMDFEHRDDVTVEEYIEMIRLKTSVLIGCACRMGAIMGDAPEHVQNALYTFGEKLGLAFQLQDDYLDTYGDALLFGKEIGGDIVNNKKTWLLITALSEDRSGDMLRLVHSGNSLKNSEKIVRVKAIYDSLNLVNRCKELINKYVDEAIESLNAADLKPETYDFFAQFALRTKNRSN